MLANVNRDPKKRAKPFLPSEFNPYHLPAAGAAVADQHVEVPVNFLKMFVPGAKW